MDAALLNSLAFALACALVLGSLAPRTWLGELSRSVRPQIAAFGFLLCLGCTVLSQWIGAALALIVAGFSLWAVRTHFAPATEPLQRRSVRIIWANVQKKKSSLQAVLRHANKLQVDIVAIGEPPWRGWEGEVDCGPFAHQVGPRAHSAGWTNVRLLSRTPLTETEVLEPLWRGSLKAHVEIQGRVFTLIATHPSSPKSPARWRARQIALEAAFAAAPEHGPVILIGDCNTTTWSRAWPQAGRLQRTALGPWATWVAPLPFIGLPIDHAFVAGVRRAHVRLGPYVGSDHWPLILDVEF